jgi:hypothetical protein
VRRLVSEGLSVYRVDVEGLERLAPVDPFENAGGRVASPGYISRCVA